MGSSARKKREKKKDFQKAKLKVGKTKPKPSNLTDTSFQSKKISLSKQSLNLSAPSRSAIFNHHFSLITSRSDRQRKDSVAHLANALSALAATAHHVSNDPHDHDALNEIPYPKPPRVLITAVISLMPDPSSDVRSNALKILQSLPPSALADNISNLTLQTRSGMLSMLPEIRLSALDVLDHLLAVAGDALVSSLGGWSKMLHIFTLQLRWPVVKPGSDQPDNPVTIPGTSKSAAATKGGTWVNDNDSARLRAHLLKTFARFLEVGLSSSAPSTSSAQSTLGMSTFPLWHTAHHAISHSSSRPFDRLGIYDTGGGASSSDGVDGGGVRCEDAEERRGYFRRGGYEVSVRKGAEMARREGGEVGRGGKNVEGALDEHMGETSQDSGRVKGPGEWSWFSRRAEVAVVVQ